MKRFANEIINGWNEKPIRVPYQEEGSEKREIVDAKLYNIMYLIMVNAPFKTQEDSKNGMWLAQSLEKAKSNGFIEIEESVHDWLKKVTSEISPALFKIDGNIVYELIKEGFEKVRQPASGSEKPKVK